MPDIVYFVMDPIESINRTKDTTLAFIYEAGRRQCDVRVTEPSQLWLTADDGKPEVHGSYRKVLNHKTIESFELGTRETGVLNKARYVFMRQDPPVSIEYLNTTFLLDFLQDDGVLVVNNSTQVRSANEKLTALQFTQVTPPTVVSAHKHVFQEFLIQHKDIIIKPLDGMGGQGVFRVKAGDQNLDSIIEMLTRNNRLQIMAQRYIPEIIAGDKRILMINGEPVPYALARVPQNGALRGNLAAGGQGIGQPLTERDLEICRHVGPWLKAHHIYFAGLDVIGDYLTEVNVTSPTCVRELDKIYNLNISADLFNVLADL